MKPQLRLVQSKPSALRAALYCRKSTGDAEKDDELKSTKLQETNARTYAAERGLKVVACYRDEDISGNRVNRPDFDQLLAALGIDLHGSPDARRRREPDAGSRPFDVLICRDQSRLVRNQFYDLRILHELVVWAGVELHFYKDRQVWTRENFNELVLGVQGIVASQQRKNTSKDVREGMETLARLGRHTGGAVYGYTIKQVLGPSDTTGVERRLYSTLVVNKAEADIVLGIFKMFVHGRMGARAISKTLNGDPNYRSYLRKYFAGRTPTKPVIGERKSRGNWTPSSVRDMLRRERYIGMATFGQMRNAYDTAGNLYHFKEKQKDKIIATPVPKWRIVSDELWQAAQTRIVQLRKAYVRDKDGRLIWGRPESGRHSKYLLSGLMRCALCNGSIVGSKYYHGGKLIPFYVCSQRNAKGITGCANGTHAKVDTVNQDVLAYLDRMLRPGVIEKALKVAQARQKAELRKDPTLRKTLEAELRTAQQEKRNLIAVQAHLDNPEDVADRINECNRQIKAAEAKLADLSDGPDSKVLAERQQRLLEVAATYRELMQERRNLVLARQVLRKAFREQPFICTPVVRNGTKTFSIQMPSFVLSASLLRDDERKVRFADPKRPIAR